VSFDFSLTGAASKYMAPEKRIALHQKVHH
jgi:hypothetical protein